MAYVNLEWDPDLAVCFALIDPSTILTLLEPRLRRTITPGQTLLFLDGVQATPEILAMLRWLYEDLPAQHVVVGHSRKLAGRCWRGQGMRPGTYPRSTTI